MNQNNNYCVYMHIVPNGKRYIGMSRNIKSRWKNNGYGYKNNIEFYNAIVEYGWDNIDHLIIADNLTKEDAKVLEEQLILEHKTYESEYGYNKFIGFKMTEEMKIARSEALKGKHHTEETKQKMSEAHKGVNNPTSKKVICTTTMTVFDSLIDGAEYYGIHKENISNCCKGKRKSAGKYNNQKLIWRYIDTIIEL